MCKCYNNLLLIIAITRNYYNYDIINFYSLYDDTVSNLVSIQAKLSNCTMINRVLILALKPHPHKIHWNGSLKQQEICKFHQHCLI